MDVNPIKLMDLAKMASDRFLQEDVPLNSAIASVAEAHELNPFQIERVAEIANHEVNLRLLKQSEDKNFTFELADPKVISKSIGQGPLEKVAGYVTEDDLSDAFGRTIDIPDMPVFEPNMDNQIQLDRACTVTLEKLAAKADLFKRELASRHFTLMGELENVVGQITKVAKDHILLNKGMLSDLLKFACTKDPEGANGYLLLFQGIKEDLMKLGAPVDRALISDDLSIPDGTLEIINGGHILSVLLDTFKRKISDEDRCSRRLRLMDTFGDAVVDQIRTIKTPDDVSRDLYESLDALDKKAEYATLDDFVEYLEKEALKVPAGKIALILAALGGAHALGTTAKHTTKGVIKETMEPYDERRELAKRTRSDY
jgi:hypothetical protein